MALVEDNELEQLRAWARVGQQSKPSKDLLDAMGKNPKTRQRILSLMKEINPDLAIPEIDAAKPVLDELSKTKEEIAALKKQLEDRAAEEVQKRAKNEVEETITKGRAKLKAMGFTKEGIDAVEKMMQERGLADYEAAGALYDRENPQESDPITPTTGNFGRDSGLFAPPEDNVWAKAVSLPKGRGQERALAAAQNGEINKWFAENRLQRRARA